MKKNYSNTFYGRFKSDKKKLNLDVQRIFNDFGELTGDVKVWAW